MLRRSSMPCIKKYLLFTVTILVMCTISFIHIFISPFYDITPKLIVLQENVNFEKSLCESKIKYNKSNEQPGYYPCPEISIVTVWQGGRLGNQVWEYASAWAFARQHGLEVYAPRCILERLEKVFENLTVRALDEIAHCPLDLNAFVGKVEKWHNTDQSLVLPQCVVLVETVLAWIKDVPQEFIVKKELREKADDILQAANKQQYQLPVYVGIHVRRSDYETNFLLPKYHIKFADAKYFYNAMDYFEQKYQSVVFVVVSDDVNWCSENLTKKPNVYIVGKKTSPEQDWAIMAACNHSIIDYGTYGMWGAVLAGGETIVYNITNHWTMRAVKALPYWHALSSE